MSLLALFMVVGGAKFAVQSCIEPAENSKKLKKKWLGIRIYPPVATASAATGKGKKKKEKANPGCQTVFLICMNTSICCSGQRI